jgi:DNA repair protein RecN (Recombination protein N)
MLNHLTISNFALVRQLDLGFEELMTVVTGETGAGKSIILDALALTLGDRADINLIAAGESKAEIHSTFDLKGINAAVQWLQERELIEAADDDQMTVILRRVITRDGRSRGFINGAPSTLVDMRALGNLLIDIHSQHEHQSLLKRESHRRLLDEYGGLDASAAKVRAIFTSFRDCQTTLERILENSKEQSARLQLLTYQANELNELDLLSGELESLELEQKRLSTVEDNIHQCQEAAALFSTESGAETDTVACLSRAVSLLSSLDDAALKPIIDLLSTGIIQIEEASRDLENYVQKLELDPARLQVVEKRLDIIYNIARKHRIHANDIPTLIESVRQDLAAISHADEDINQLNESLDKLGQNYKKEATKLSKGRKKASKALAKKVSIKLDELGMNGAQFLVDLSSNSAAEPAINGMEEIEFRISTNPGQKPGALNKIASGGELSRISLAIQVVTANTSNVPTLVFDEVDVGIGGATAEVVGRLLRELGRKAQIVCVTHLPQVAAQGHNHLKVLKTSDNNGSNVVINRLTEEDKIEEIARMLGGIDMTDHSLAHAKEMFAASQT